MVDAGLIALYRSFRLPLRPRQRARAVRSGEFLEVFRYAGGRVPETRPKGLYKRADAGQIRNFTGVDAPYEEPIAPEIRLPTVELSAEALAERVVEELRRAELSLVKQRS